MASDLSGCRVHHEILELATHQREALIDVTDDVRAVVRRSATRDGLVTVYAQGATAAMMIQENWDESVRTDVIHLLQRLIPRGVRLHDRQDGNGDAHLKSGLIGPSESIPWIEGRLGLSNGRTSFFEFDGPRRRRRFVCTVVGTP